MVQTITPEICGKLGEIGFGEDEINTIKMIHELKTRAYPMDIKKLINKAAFEALSEGVTKTFEKNRWSEEDFFEIVEMCRDKKKKK